MGYSKLEQLSISERERLLKAAEARLISKTTESAPIPILQDRQNLPLSFAQQRLWFLGRMEGGSEAYHVPMGVRLRGRLDGAALKRALDRIVARHEALRTAFVTVDGEPKQRVTQAEESSFQLLEHDLRQQQDAAGVLDRLIAEEAREGFDWEAGPLIRGRLIQLADQEHALLITMHHIVSDWWSMGVLFKELGTLYEAFSQGGEDPLPELAVQYADYAVWQRRWMEGEVLKQQAGYWRKNLEGAPELLELPADHVRPARQDYAGELVELALEHSLTVGLKKLSAQHGTTLYTTLLTGWAVLLGRLSGQHDLVVGTPVANRGRVEIENLIGFFVNTLLVRVDLSGKPTVGEVLERVKRQALAAQQHQDLPFEEVVEIMQPVRSLAHSPLFQVTFTYLDRPEARPQLSGLETMPLQSSPHVVSKFDIALLLQESRGKIEGVVEYATALFERGTIERYLGYFRKLLEGMVADDAQVVDRLPLLSEPERRQVLYEWNDTTKYPDNSCVHQLFEEQVRKTPDAVAAVFEDACLSYRELNRQANRLAHYLRDLGVRPDARVGICLERSLDMIVSLLAVLKAGGAYVPLDPSYPVERLQFMLQDSAPTVLLTQRSLLQTLLPQIDQQSIPVIDLTDTTPVRSSWPESDPDCASVALSSKHLAYVIYTSGSTGRPKGVMVEHRNVLRLFTATEAWFQFGAGDVWSSFHSYAFDFSVWEIWGALLHSGRLILISGDTARSPEDFYKLVCRERVTILNQTPSAFRQLITAQAKSNEVHQLRYVIFGGERLEPATLKPWYGQNHGYLTQLVNMYGITETTVHVTYRPLGQDDTDRRGGSPIGRRIPDLRAYILDAQQQPVPVGVAGELYIGGAGVARGYLNRAELTAERFLNDPFVADPGARMYKTGDLGRWLGDGMIEFLGRNDFQVKIRGYRIELGEVEAALREQGGVREAVAMAWRRESGDKQLVGYVVGEEGVKISASEVREGMRKKLPEYMVPVVVVLEELPLTGNGKVDRGKLPGPEEVLEERGGKHVGPRNRTEEILAEVWAGALGLERVGVEENFFELGGDSILCVRIVGRGRERGLDFSVQDLFERQTIAELAELIEEQGRQDGSKSGEDRIFTAPFALVREEVRRHLPEEIEDAYPLSRLQAGMLFHTGYAPESGVYHDVFSYRVRLPYDAETMQRVVDVLTQRHSMLRTSIDMGNYSEPIQLVHWQVKLRVVEEDWRGKSAEEQEAGLAEFGEREFRTGFVWEQAPHLRIFVHWLREEEFQCSFSFHHAIMDGWSLASLITQLVQDYRRGLAGEEVEVKPLGVCYRDYIALERRAMASEESASFWKEMLQEHTVTPVPFTDWRKEEESRRPAETVARTIVIEKETQEHLQRLAREMGVPLKTVLLAGHMKALQVMSGGTDVTTAVVHNGRPEMDGGERVIGLFLNSLPFRLHVQSRSWKSLIEETFALEKRIVPHRRYPMVELQNQMGGQALFKTAFNYLHFHVYKELERGGRENKIVIEEQSGYSLTSGDFLANFNLSVETGKLAGTVQCDTGVLNAAALERIAEFYERILAAMIEDRIGDVREEKERRQIEEWSQLKAEVPSGMYELLKRSFGSRWPRSNRRIFILDEHREPVPIGVTGEIYIGGTEREDGNRLEENWQRFCRDGFVEEGGVWIYQTGELGRWGEDGEVEFLGRKDDQVKIRGYRIQLREIETQLKGCEGVKEAAVVVREDVSGEKRLVAYYTVVEEGISGGEGPKRGELHQHMSEKLPEYMVPKAYVQLEELPLTSNGAVDREALPMPTDLQRICEYEAPEGEIETMVAGIWADVLQVERVGRQDNFFSLGGRSLLAVQVTARLRQSLGVEVGVNALFARPVLASFAEWIIDQQLATFDANDLANALKHIG